MNKTLLRTVAVALCAVTPESYSGREMKEPVEKTFATPEEAFPAGSLTLGGQFGDDLTTGFLDSITPFWAPGETMFFLNTRSSIDNDEQGVTSIGLGARHLIPDRQIILGANIFYDSIHGRDSSDFDQLGLGVEVLSRWVDARFNYYLPEGDQHAVHTRRERSTSSSTGTPFVVGGQIRQSTVTRTTDRTFRQYEAALEGWNAEVGFLIPGLDRYLETRLFGGYYHYHNPFGGDFEGFKARLEARFLPGVIGDLEWWDDEHVVGSNWFGGVRVSVPFSLYNLVKGRNPFEGAAENFKPRQRDLRERQAEMIIRSHRVKTITSGEIQTQENTSTRTTTETIGTVPRPAGGGAPPPPQPLPPPEGLPPGFIPPGFLEPA